MKIQLDYDNKQITLENNVKFGEFISKIKSILPDWKEWELQTNTIIGNWYNPIYIRDYSSPWWYGRTISGGTVTVDGTNVQQGSYCLELN